MIGREQEVNLPLIIENFIATVKMGLVGTDAFWQQFDQFTLYLIPPSSLDADGPPLILLSAEFHIPSNTPVPVIEDTELGNIMLDAVKATLNRNWDGLFVKWESGFSGGNPRGWDINFYGVLGEAAKQLSTSADGEELFRYEKPLRAEADRELGGQASSFEFDLNKGGIIFIGPNGAISADDLEKAKKAPYN